MSTPTEKRCPKCAVLKPIDEFDHYKTKAGRMATCRRCRDMQRKYRGRPVGSVEPTAPIKAGGDAAFAELLGKRRFTSLTIR